MKGLGKHNHEGVCYYICESCRHKATFSEDEDIGECGVCGGEWLYDIYDPEEE